MRTSFYRYSLFDRKTGDLLLFKTMKELATHLGVSAHTVSRHIRGKCQNYTVPVYRRWKRYRVHRVRVPCWNEGFSWRLNKYIKDIRKRVLKEIKLGKKIQTCPMKILIPRGRL